jgi:tetratricopeptide (TPR) repeat protein
MKQILFILIAVACTLKVSAQVMPDVNRMMSMTPAERQKYGDSLIKAATKNATNMADKYGLALDETVLPGSEIKPPVKDIAKLSLIPSRPPTRTELVQQVQKSQQQLQSVMPKPEVAEVQKFSAQQSAAEIHEASIGKFYNNEPAKALYLMMEAAKQQPDSAIVWNNLGSMYNMVGLSHKAIPMLQHALQKVPGSSMILNNIAQSYFNLGDLAKARQYLEECLAIDSLNPDANHSMGMLHMFAKNYDKAMASFERELSVAMRASTLAYAAKMGKKFNLRALMKKRNAMNSVPQKDYFEEIALGKFKIPNYPMTVKEAYEQVPEFMTLGNSIGQEIMFWNTIGFPSKEQIEREGRSRPGMYSSLVKALLDELGEEFTPEYLANSDDSDFEAAGEIMNNHLKVMMSIQCPKPPQGASLEAQHAYEVKCCKEIKTPLVNQYLATYGGFWQPKMRVAQGRWKSYINQMIAIVQLDPSSGNQLAVYRTVAAYFTFMARAMSYSGTTEAIKHTLPYCDTLTIAEADSVIEADRKWRLECPSWLNIEVDFESGKVKADCNKFGLEVGDGIFGLYEHEFKTGSSTLAVGQGVKAKFFGGIGKASLKEMIYVTFDNNNQFSDFGVRRKAEVSIDDTPFKIGKVKYGGTILGVEGTWQTGINTGHTFTVKGKGLLTDFVNLSNKP